MAAYSNSFPGTHLSDDFPIVLENPVVIEPHLPTILTADYWGVGVNSRLHRPLTILSFAVNRALFGPAAFSFHFVNVLLHAGVTLLLYGALLSLGLPAGVSWPAAALFAVHPIHTETVNIITGRSELFAALFVLLGLLLAFRGGRRHLLWVGAAHLGALFSKESGAVFPLLLFLGDLFADRDLRGLLRRRWRLYAQSAALTLFWLALRAWALPSSRLPFNTTIRPLDNPLVDLALPLRVATALKVQLLYLGKLLLPVRLHAVYTDRMLGPVTGAGDPWLLAAPLIVAGLGGLVVFGWRRREAYALGLAFQAAAFLATGNLIVVTPYLMAERFAYLPSAGFCLALTGLAAAALGRIGDPARRQLATCALFAVLVALLAGRTLVRNRDFRDHAGLWETETRSEPGNIRAWLFLSGAYQQRGRLDDAEQALLAVTRIDPRLPEGWSALGDLCLRNGRAAEARDAFRRSLDSGLASEEAGLGLAAAALQLGEPREALAVLSWLESLYRDREAYWLLVGRAREATGDAEGARTAYGAARALGGAARKP